jgi:hypothetical protein
MRTNKPPSPGKLKPKSRLCAQPRLCAQLVEDKFFEGIINHCRCSVGVVSGVVMRSPPNDENWQS